MSFKHIVNGKSRVIDVNRGWGHGQDIIDAMIIERPNSALPKNVVVGTNIIPIDQFKAMPLAPGRQIHIMDADVEKGNGESALTAQEVRLVFEDVQRFFEFEHPGIEPEGYVEDDCFVIENFPIPSHYGEQDIPLMMLLTGFPELAPAGFYVPTEHPATPNLAKVFSAFDDKPPYARVEGLKQQHWTWLCNGIRGRNFEGAWRYEFTTKHGKDSLMGLLAFFQAEIYRGAA